MGLKEKYPPNTTFKDSNEINNYEKEVSYTIGSLKRLSVKNEYLGYIITISFFTMLVLVIIGIFSINKSEYWVYNALAIVITIFMIIVLFIIIFQNNAKKANVLFDELADYMENNNVISNNIEYKINIKRYLVSTELPLIQGKYGSTIYFILTLILFVFSITYLFVIRNRL